MGNQEKSLEYSATCDPDDMAQYLEALAQCIRDGRIAIADGHRSIELRCSESVRFELEAKSKPEKGKESLNLELSWKRSLDDRGPADLVSQPGLLISKQIDVPGHSTGPEAGPTIEGRCPFLVAEGESIKVVSCPFLTPVSRSDE